MRAGHDGKDAEVVSGFCRTVQETDAMDAALDRELEAALRVAPSPSLTARVRTELASQEPPANWRFEWILPAGAVALVSIAALTFTITRQPADAPARPAASVAPSPEAVTFERPVAADRRPTTSEQRPPTT